MTAAAQLVGIQFPDMIRSGKVLTGWLNIGLTLFVVLCVALLLLMAVARWVAALAGMTSPQGLPERAPASVEGTPTVE